MNQCLYCLTQALKVDPSDVEALWELANIHRAQNNKLKVRSCRCPGWSHKKLMTGGQSIPETGQA